MRLKDINKSDLYYSLDYAKGFKRFIIIVPIHIFDYFKNDYTRA